MPPANDHDPVRTIDHAPTQPPAGANLTATIAQGATSIVSSTDANFSVDGEDRSDKQPELAIGSVSVPGYEIEGVLGRGGMGVVYKARHLTLKRTVALKMILTGGHAGPTVLARFRIEAEAVARLQHPNIVGVFEVGEAGGHPYCALEYVEGGALAAQIDGNPMPPRECARLVETLARAMQFAHSRNVVHRDLKPANILLKKDEGGRMKDEQDKKKSDFILHPSSFIFPKITDFGLARQLDSDSSQTQAGAVMGTPSYMAPEQAAGHAHDAGPAADIYALGAILYDCLTGRPPFRGTTIVETLDQVRTQEPAPPSRWQPGVPLDLETICLKCLQKEPEKRYASAAELADDLLRYQQDEPILARPVGTVERGWRWCRRNPWLAGLSATAALLLVCIGIGSAVVAVQLAAKNKAIETEKEAALKAQEEAQKNEQDALAARQLADRNAQEAATQAGIALGALQTLIKTVQEQLGDVPGTQQLKEDLLKTALAEVDKVHKAAEKSTSIEATRMAALMQLGQLYRQLGKSAEAMAQFRKIYEIAQARVVLKKGTDASRLNLALCARSLADMDREVNRDMQAALAHEKEALAIFEDIDRHPKTDDKGEGSIDKRTVKDHEAEMNKRVGIIYLRLGDIPQAAAFFETALALQRQRYAAVLEDQSAKPMDKLQHKLYVALTLLAIGDTAYRLDYLAKANVSFAESLQSYEEMFAQNPKLVPMKRGLTAACLLIGDYHLRTGDHARAGELYGRAQTLLRELAQADPKKFDSQWDLGSIYYRLGQLALRTKNAPAARMHFQDCLAIRQQLADKDSVNDRRKMELMLVLSHCGEHTKAAQIATALEKTSKPDAEFLIDLARTYAHCMAAADSDAKLQAHYKAEALRVLRSAIALGYRDRMYVKLEVDLDPLRKTDEFMSIIKDMGQQK